MSISPQILYGTIMLLMILILKLYIELSSKKDSLTCATEVIAALTDQLMHKEGHLEECRNNFITLAVEATKPEITGKEEERQEGLQFDDNDMQQHFDYVEDASTSERNKELQEEGCVRYKDKWYRPQDETQNY